MELKPKAKGSWTFPWGHKRPWAKNRAECLSAANFLVLIQNRKKKKKKKKKKSDLKNNEKKKVGKRNKNLSPTNIGPPKIGLFFSASPPVLTKINWIIDHLTCNFLFEIFTPIQFYKDFKTWGVKGALICSI